METMNQAVARSFRIERFRNARVERVMDNVAIEEPLQICLQYWFKDAQIFENLALTMRTPGHDHELAAGFLLSEGIIQQRRHIIDIRSLGTEFSNEIVVELSKEVDLEGWRLARSTFMNSACGVCGKRSLDALMLKIPVRRPDRFQISAALVEKLPGLLQERQQGFAETGGLHAAALINANGVVESLFEDIGRHNALDKLLGWCVWNDQIHVTNRLLFLSSRSSFELVQRAAMAGAPVMATVGSPSSLAIEAARRYEITLIGFVRDARFNVYSGEWRINS